MRFDGIQSETLHALISLIVRERNGIALVETKTASTIVRSFTANMQLALYSVSDAALSLGLFFFPRLCLEYLSLFLCTFALVFGGFLALSGCFGINHVFDLLLSLLQIALGPEIALETNQDSICSGYAHARHVGSGVFEAVHKGSETFGWRRVVTGKGAQSSQLASLDANQTC